MHLVIYETRTTTRSCRDPETAVSNFWSPAAAAASAAAAGAAAACGKARW